MISAQEIRARAEKQFSSEMQRGVRVTRDEIRLGKNGSISVRLTGEKAGLYYDFESQTGGSLLDETEARPNRAPAQRRNRPTVATGSVENFDRIRAQLGPIEGTPAEIYLRSRGIDRWPHSLKFSFAPFGLFAVAQNRDGNPMAGQVVYLNRAGQKRPSNGVKKRTYKAVENWSRYAAVRFPGRGELILAEGVETAASIWLATGRPVAACLGPAGFRELRIPGKRLTIARDGDEPGSPADKFLIGGNNTPSVLDIRRKFGIRVKIASPPIGMDFNDVHQRDGLQEVARLIRAAEVPA